MKFKIFKFKSVTSTNDVAINLIKEKQKISGCVHADKQTKGRGTHGKKWVSEKGNLFVSMFFPLDKNFPPFNEFATINSIIISNVIKKLCNDKKITLKFPYDIFLNKKKICVLLQELITLKERRFLIIGIGINIIKDPKIKEKYQSTSIFMETNTKPSVSKVVDLIISSYENFFIELSSYKYENYIKSAESLSLI